MQRHSVCYNSCSAFEYLSESLPLPHSSFECSLSQYSSNIQEAATKRESYNDYLLICFTGFGSLDAFWLAMDANVNGEGPSNMNNDEENPHAEDIDDLYEESDEEGEIDPLEFNLPSEGDVLMEDAPIHNPRGVDEWTKTVLIAAKGNEYSGEDVGDFSERSQLVVVYKFQVNEAVNVSRARRAARLCSQEIPQGEDQDPCTVGSSEDPGQGPHQREHLRHRRRGDPRDHTRSHYPWRNFC
jgi:hypothetical protein